MGYYITCEDSNFQIKDEKAALSSILREHKRDPLLSNSQLSNELSQATTLDQAFECCFWELQRDKDGKIVRLVTENTMVAELERLFPALAPFVLDGSYLVIVGEESEAWRVLFHDGKCAEEEWE